MRRAAKIGWVEPLPDRVETERLVLRIWEPDDIPALGRAITESIEHLRPWMPWIAFEPLSDDDRRKMITDWHSTRDAGGEVVFGIFDRDGNVVGGTGFHRRSRDPAILEIGYWIHVDHVGRGYATEAARALVDAAFARPEIAAVDIKHDRANVRSRRVPEKLGFLSLGEHPDTIDAPAEEGVACHWRLTRPRTDGTRLRTARAEHRPAILDLVRSAFRPGDEEVDIVERTWALGDAIPHGLEIVALDDNEVVGYVLGAVADLDGRTVIAVAPLAVAPGRQGTGIGSALMRELVARATADGWPLVALLGSHEYYSQFGFEPAGSLGITYAPVGADSPHFQVFRLPRYDDSFRGNVTYCWEGRQP